MKRLRSFLTVMLLSAGAAPALALPLPTVPPEYTILEIADGDGPLLGPSGIEQDAQGNLYIVEPVGHGVTGDKIYKLTPSGDLSVFVEPPGVAFIPHADLRKDRSGNLYVWDQASGWILKIDPSGGGGHPVLLRRRSGLGHPPRRGPGV